MQLGLGRKKLKNLKRTHDAVLVRSCYFEVLTALGAEIESGVLKKN